MLKILISIVVVGIMVGTVISFIATIIQDLNVVNYGK